MIGLLGFQKHPQAPENPKREPEINIDYKVLVGTEAYKSHREEEQTGK
jgi:hypothetical protein